MKLTIQQEHEKLKYTTRNCKISQNLTQFLTKFNGCTLRIATFWPLLSTPPPRPKKNKKLQGVKLSYHLLLRYTF